MSSILGLAYGPKNSAAAQERSRRSIAFEKGPLCMSSEGYKTFALTEPSSDAFYRAKLPSRSSEPWNATLKPRFAHFCSDVLQNQVNRAFDHIESFGLEKLQDRDGRLPRPLVLMSSHTKAMWDALVLAGLRNSMPKMSDWGHRAVPRFLMRQPTGWQKVGMWIGGGLFTAHVSTQDQKDKFGADNRLGMGKMLAAVERGELGVFFPEARVRGDGTVWITKIGAVRALHRLGEEVQSPLFAAVSVVYEQAPQRAKPVAYVSFGPPFTVQNVDDPKAVCADMQRAITRASTLTLTGIVGAYLLETRACRLQVHLSREKMQTLVAETVRLVQARQSPCEAAALNEVPIAAYLRDPKELAAAVRASHAQFSAPPQPNTPTGYLDASGCLVFPRLGDRGDPTGPVLDYERLRTYCHLEDPLRYWGNRFLQQGYQLPELGEVFKQVVGRINAAAPAIERDLPPAVALSSPVAG